MKAVQSVSAVFLLATLTARAEPERLVQLRGNYAAAVERALTPLQRVYLEELEKLKAALTREGKLEDALAVDTEMKTLAGPTSNAERDALKSTLVAGPWNSAQGEVITLAAEGTGTWKSVDRVTECTWEVIVEEGKLLAVIYYEGKRENFNAIELSKNGKAMKVTYRPAGKVMEFER